MRLSKLEVRFFRSFNFDYERKADPKAQPKPWEEIDGAWYPFISIDLDSTVTAVVGANESGKSHLIEAVWQALSGKGIDHRDFCRYSKLFSVKEGEIRSPDFGIELELVRPEDDELVSQLELPLIAPGLLKLFRLDEGTRILVIGPGDETHQLTEEQAGQLQEALPNPFKIEATVALPDSVAFSELLGEKPSPLRTRRRRAQMDELLGSFVGGGIEALQGRAQEILGMLDQDADSDDDDSSGLREQDLARMLLLDVAEISIRSIEDLRNAVRNEQEGQVGGLLERMNQALAQRLNFSRWWRQDNDFQLRVATRERELVFTIRDRTGTDYSFEERSRGLQYFLSYYVQLLAHRRTATRETEILLMDEPDAYLSSLGQQDLLRALERFARPEDGGRKDQVVYVTHSPFLINKNAGHRIRVLDKGTNEEGTRVVSDVAQNHFEPLRSSLGTYVAETTFISGSNLLVEGLSDQVLLAGITSLLRQRDVAPPRLLNLNEVTIVPAGGASTVPYMAYLARGRGDLKAACVALLDGDKAGLEAKRQLLRKVPGRAKPSLKERYVLDVGSWAELAKLKLESSVIAREPEDLIPAALIAEAGRNYARRLLGIGDSDTKGLTAEKIKSGISDAEGSLWGAAKAAFANCFDGAAIEKVGFAKELVALLESSAQAQPPASAVATLEANFEPLIAELAQRLREADAEETDERTEKRSERVVRIFLRDHPEGALRHEADQALIELESALEDTPGDEGVRNHLAALRQAYDLQANPTSQVSEFEQFRDKLRDLRAVRRHAWKEAAKVTPVKPAPKRKRSKPKQSGQVVKSSESEQTAEE
jgi:predicted ATPase